MTLSKHSNLLGSCSLYPKTPFVHPPKVGASHVYLSMDISQTKKYSYPPLKQTHGFLSPVYFSRIRTHRKHHGQCFSTDFNYPCPHHLKQLESFIIKPTSSMARQEGGLRHGIPLQTSRLHPFKNCIGTKRITVELQTSILTNIPSNSWRAPSIRPSFPCITHEFIDDVNMILKATGKNGRFSILR